MYTGTTLRTTQPIRFNTIFSHSAAVATAEVHQTAIVSASSIKSVYIQQRERERDITLLLKACDLLL